MDYDKYENKLPYSMPKEAMEKVYNEHERFLENVVATRKEYEEVRSTLEQERIKLNKEYQVKYGLETARLNDLFWADAFEELGIQEDHPKADKMRSYAWSNGHGSGYSAVYSALSDIWEVVE